MSVKRLNIVYSVFNDHYKKTKNIRTIEILIFLAQRESLDKLSKPLLNNKIYIYEGRVKIPYISDLLRVGEKQYISYRGYDITQMRVYLKLVNKYKTYTDVELEEEAKKIISDHTLSEKNFLYSDYCNKNYRRYARLIMNQENHVILSIIRKIFIAIPALATFVVLLIGIYFIYFMGIKDKLTVQNLIFIILIDLFLIVAYIGWTLLWMKPTKFEIQNGYLDD